MKALHFMKIDYILTRKQFYSVLVFFLVALVMSKSMGEGMSVLVACSYMLFVASIFATMPFAYCVGKSKSFLFLLPATVKDRVAGRFLYGLSFVALQGVLCGVIVGVYMIMGVEVPLWMFAAAFCEFAVVIVIMALEFLFFYLFGEGKENWQHLSNIVRVAPGMALFFATSYLIDGVQDAAASDMGVGLEGMAEKLMLVGVLSIVVALFLTAAAAAVCVKAIEKRDYA